jgi:hypothetical protein
MGQLGCVSCKDETSLRRLKHGNKQCFMGHRRFFVVEPQYASDRERDSRTSGSTARGRACGSAGKQVSEAKSPGDDCSTNLCNTWTVTLFCVTTGHIFITHFICSIYVLQHNTLL